MNPRHPDATPEGALIPARLIVAAVVIISLCVLTLSGCAPYWRPIEGCTPIQPTGILETHAPGGRTDLDGYANRYTRTIEIKPGLHPALRECVLSHERKHFDCWYHDNRVGFATDCGDGRRV